MEKEFLDQSEAAKKKKKKFVFETKIFHKTRVRGVIEEEEVRV
jgi:hypothetical protein